MPTRDKLLIRDLAEALEAALAGWKYALEYKGEYLPKKRGDAEEIARLCRLLNRVNDAWQKAQDDSAQ